MIDVIYCPKCLVKGRKKKIARVERGSNGTVYLWCKCCKEEIAINLKEPRANSKG